MRVLIIKMSSMGDVIHTLPALTDAGHMIPGISFDWVVEESFQEIPHWHPRVKNVIPIALRRWRKKIFSIKTLREIKKCIHQIRENQYDLIIDAQGLLKSAFVSRFAKGIHVGPNYFCARDPIASVFYQKKYFSGKVKEVHAVTRLRQLFSLALGYLMPATVADYGTVLSFQKSHDNYIVFLHGTTWATKHWPEIYWVELAKLAEKNNIKVKITWGSEAERERAMRIAAACAAVEVLPRLKLQEVTGILAAAKAIVAVDTGLGHLAAALNVPTVSLYGPTDPELTGALGASQTWLKAKFSCSPCLSRQCVYSARSSYRVQPACFSTVTPSMVWAKLGVCDAKE